MAEGIELGQAHRDDCLTQANDAYNQTATASAATGRDQVREETAALIAALAYRCRSGPADIEEVVAALRRQYYLAGQNFHLGQSPCMAAMLAGSNFPVIS